MSIFETEDLEDCHFAGKERIGACISAGNGYGACFAYSTMKWVVGVLLLIAGLFAQAQEPTDFVAGTFDSGREAVEALQQLPTVPMISQDPGEDISFVYDPAEFSVSPEEVKAMPADILSRLKNNIAIEQRAAAGGYFVPTSPSNEALLQGLQGMSTEDLQLFLVKKQKFLEKIGNWIQWARLPRFIHNKMIKVFNDQFYGSARVIARANAQGGSVRLLGSVGLGINSILAEKFKGTALGKWFPKTGGVFLMLGIGVSLARVDLDGRQSWVFEVFADYSRLKSAQTFLASGAVGLNFNYLSEVRQSNEALIHDYEGKNKGPMGMVMTGEGHFSYGPAAVLSFPPFVGAAMFYEIKQKRITLLRSGSAGRADAAVNTCDKIFAF